MKRVLQITFFFLLFAFILIPSTHSNAKKGIRFTKHKTTIDIYKSTNTTLKVKKKV